MAVHWDAEAATKWKTGRKLNATVFPNGGRLPEKPVTERGKRRAQRKG